MIVDFKECKLVPIELKDFEFKVFAPVLTMYEYESIISRLIDHCEAIEEFELDSKAKEYLKSQPPKEPKDEKEKLTYAKGGNQFGIEVTNRFEQQKLLRAGVCLAQLQTTMFLCNENGEALMPLTESFGTISQERLRFFSQIVAGDTKGDIVLRISYIITGQDFDKILTERAKEEEVKTKEQKGAEKKTTTEVKPKKMNTK